MLATIYMRVALNWPRTKHIVFLEICRFLSRSAVQVTYVADFEKIKYLYQVHRVACGVCSESGKENGSGHFQLNKTRPEQRVTLHR